MTDDRSYPARPIVGIGIVVFKGSEVLLIQRGKPPRQGQWSLPGGVQEGILFASDITTQQNLAKVPAARNYAMAEMGKAGVQFYSPTAGELEEWTKAGGYQRSEWDGFKKELAGSLDTFGKLEEAANTPSRLYVHDA